MKSRQFWLICRQKRHYFDSIFTQLKIIPLKASLSGCNEVSSFDWFAGINDINLTPFATSSKSSFWKQPYPLSLFLTLSLERESKAYLQSHDKCPFFEKCLKMAYLQAKTTSTSIFCNDIKLTIFSIWRNLFRPQIKDFSREREKERERERLRKKERPRKRSRERESTTEREKMLVSGFKLRHTPKWNQASPIQYLPIPCESVVDQVKNWDFQDGNFQKSRYTRSLWDGILLITGMRLNVSGKLEFFQDSSWIKCFLVLSPCFSALE